MTEKKGTRYAEDKEDLNSEHMDGNSPHQLAQDQDMLAALVLAQNAFADDVNPNYSGSGGT